MIAAWIEVLALSSLTLQAIQAAVIKRARAGLERPTPGQIYHEAVMIEREFEYTPSHEERAKVKTGFKDLLARLAGKWGI